MTVSVSVTVSVSRVNRSFLGKPGNLIETETETVTETVIFGLHEQDAKNDGLGLGHGLGLEG